MACGLIIVNEGTSPTFNVGDYMQALAALQFLPSGTAPILLERDDLSRTSDEHGMVKVIMNGWWMSCPSNFPPASSIQPLYRSFHLRPRIEKFFFTTDTISHLKKYQPIGCRDTNTAEMMQAHGIKAYFSGCLTLTLGLSYKHMSQDSSPIYIIDPFVGKFLCKDMFLSMSITLRCLYTLLFRSSLIIKVANRIKETCPSKQGSGLWQYATRICAIYASSIDHALLENAIYRTHMIPAKCIGSHTERLEYARQLLSDYSKAKFVITSKLHCGLPCLGIGTPVVFVAASAMFRSGRLGGIIDLFRFALIKKGKCILNSKDFQQKSIGRTYHFSNYDRYMKYADDLMSDCQDFFR